MKSPEDFPRLDDVEKGELFYTTVFTDDRTLLRKGGRFSTSYASCLDEATGKAYNLPLWHRVELYEFQPSDVLSTPVDE